MAPPCGAGHLVGPGEQLDLAGLGHVAGQDLDDVGRRRGDPGEVDHAGAATAASGRGGGGLGRGRRPASVRSAVWAKPVVSPTTTRMPAPRSRPEVSSSTLPSSSTADDDRLSSTKTSANSPPVRSAAPRVRLMTDSSITRGPLAQVELAPAESAGRGPRSPGALAGRVARCLWYPGACTTRPERVVDHVVADDDTAIAMRSGAVPVLATPRVIALCEEASFVAVEGELQPGETTVGTKVQIDHLAPTATGHTVRAEACVEKIRAVASPSPCRSTTSAAWWPPAGSPEWWSTSIASSTRPTDQTR